MACADPVTTQEYPEGTNNVSVHCYCQYLLPRESHFDSSPQLCKHHMVIAGKAISSHPKDATCRDEWMGSLFS